MGKNVVIITDGVGQTADWRLSRLKELQIRESRSVPPPARCCCRDSK